MHSYTLLYMYLYYVLHFCFASKFYVTLSFWYDKFKHDTFVTKHGSFKLVLFKVVIPEEQAQQDNTDFFPSCSSLNKSYSEFYGDHTLFQPFSQKNLLKKVIPLSIWTSSFLTFVVCFCFADDRRLTMDSSTTNVKKKVQIESGIIFFSKFFWENC